MLFTNRDLKKLIFPLIIEQLLSISVGMFDTMMISSLGESAVSGVSLVDMLNVLMINIFSALATGGAVVCAHELGQAKACDGAGHADHAADARSRARSAAKQLLLVLLVASVGIAALAFIARRGLLRLCFGAIEDDAMGYAVTYFEISAISYPFIAIYNGLAALFRTMGNSTVTMVVSLILNLLNIGGNALLIYGLEWGVAGAAIASAISRFAGMLMLLVVIASKKQVLYIDWRERFRPQLATIKRILRIGLPNSLENSVFQLGRILVLSMIAGFGTIQTAANAVANNIDAMGVIPGQAMGLAMVTVVGQCIGAGDYKAARQYERKLMGFAYGSLAVTNLTIIAGLPLILKLYDLSEETLALATTLILLHTGFGILMWAPSFVLPNALRAAQDVRFTMVTSIFSMVAFRIALTWVIGVQMEMGIVGVWIAMLVDWLFRATCFWLRIKTGKWLSNVQRENVA
ncbi:MAG: MATE family efflux transporter [Clostridia bacterium]|nr:MATE family efflux transporter [Clostridia bacterium]